MVFLRHRGFEATTKSYFYQRARPGDIRLAERVIQGERFHPVTRALDFIRHLVIVHSNGIHNE